jgi:DNA (cytosine-5)-methyltransferase 1
VRLNHNKNLFKHNDGKTWKKMEKQLINIGYKIHKKIISPTDFGIPQDRNRFYIVGTKSKNRKFTWPTNTKKIFSFKNFIVKKPKIIRHVTKERYETLKVWNKIITNKPKNIRLINPLWTTEFK